LTLVDGRKFYCPPSTIRKEQKILHHLKDTLIPLMKDGFMSGRELNQEESVEMVAQLLSNAPTSSPRRHPNSRVRPKTGCSTGHTAFIADELYRRDRNLFDRMLVSLR